MQHRCNIQKCNRSPMPILNRAAARQCHSILAQRRRIIAAGDRIAGALICPASLFTPLIAR
jgi:hypothetical protein